jgi:hypothetical protein
MNGLFAEDEGLAHELRLEEWKIRARRWLRALPSGSEVTADDLAAAIGVPGVPTDGVHRNHPIGNWFRVQASRGLLIRTGRCCKCRRKSRKRSVQQIWKRV